MTLFWSKKKFWLAKVGPPDLILCWKRHFFPKNDFSQKFPNGQKFTFSPTVRPREAP
jgi:hypothetical protein